MTRWTSDDIPPLTGRRAIVTGATSGLGLRDRPRARPPRRPRHPRRPRPHARRGVAGGAGDRAGRRTRTRDRSRSATSTWPSLDVGPRVRRRRASAAGRTCTCWSTTPASWRSRGARRSTGSRCSSARTTSGTWRSPCACSRRWPAPGRQARPSRVVTVSSNVHKHRAHRPRRPHGRDAPTSPGRAYGQSKLANLLFTYELQRRLDAAGAPGRRLRRPPRLRRDEPVSRSARR